MSWRTSSFAAVGPEMRQPICVAAPSAATAWCRSAWRSTSLSTPIPGSPRGCVAATAEPCRGRRRP
eukprot:2861445-Lingulodinium_polyedra.AAC.1